MRRLIVNADDFGLTPGVNRGIADAHARGIVTSTTLMANAPAFDDAVRISKSLPSLGVGCHVVLLDGEPILPPESVPTLLEPGTRRFRNSLADFAMAITRGKVNPDEVEAEATAQMRKMLATGLRLSHVDSHKHTHMFPSILKPILRAAHVCGIGAVRKPFALYRTIDKMEVIRRPNLWGRYVAVQILRGFSPDFDRIVARDGMPAPNATFGIVITGKYDFDLFRHVIEQIPEGTYEFVCHPGYVDEALAAMPTQLRESRQREFEVLTSPTARKLIESRGIELISFWNLQYEAGANPSRMTDNQNNLASD